MMSLPPEAEQKLESLLEDKVSLAISGLLLKDGPSSVFKMHEKTGHSRPTLYERARRLQSAGVLLSWESGRGVLYDVVSGYREPVTRILSRKGILVGPTTAETKNVKEAWAMERERLTDKKYEWKSIPTHLPAYLLYVAGLVFTGWAVIGVIRVPDPVRVITVLISVAVAWVIIFKVRGWFSVRRRPS